jgi:5-formyltetrahydrofolate cyclo-ligase
MVHEQKKHLRQKAHEDRRIFHATVDQDILDHHLLNLFETLHIPPSVILAGYMPMGSELNILSLLEELTRRGYTVCLPVVVDHTIPLVFRAWIPEDPLMSDKVGVLSPSDTAQILIPDVLLIPLLAFDGVGNRLGHGMGHYDLTLKALAEQKPIQAIGMAYEVQKVPFLPTYPTDYPMDRVITEKRIYSFLT